MFNLSSPEDQLSNFIEKKMPILVKLKDYVQI